MKRPSIGLTVIVAGVALLAVACASMEARTPEQNVADRQQMMKQHAEAYKNVQDSAKAGNWAAVAANADIPFDQRRQVAVAFSGRVHDGQVEGQA